MLKKKKKIVGRKSYCHHSSWEHFETRPRTLIDDLTFTDFISLNTLTTINVACRISISSALWRSISWPKAVNGLPHVVSLSTLEKQEVFVSRRHQRFVFHCDTVRTRTQQRVSCCHICQDNEYIYKVFFERYIFIFRSFSLCKITTCESDSGVCYFHFLLLCVTDSGLLGFLVYWRFLSILLTWYCLYQYTDINIMIYSIHNGEGSGYLWVFTPQKVFCYIEIKR